MAVKIRLKRMGKIRTPFYRIVVADSRTKRDGRVIEEIGTYNPKTDPSTINVVSERAQYWLGVGAQPTEAVAAILKLTGDIGGTNSLKQPEPKADKAVAFEAALKELHTDLPKPKAKKVEKPVEEAPKDASAEVAEAPEDASGEAAGGDEVAEAPQAEVAEAPEDASGEAAGGDEVAEAPADEA